MAGLFYRYSDWSYCCNCSYVWTILRYFSGIRHYFLDWAIVLFFLLVNCWLSQVLLYSRSSIPRDWKREIDQLILTSAKLIAPLIVLVCMLVFTQTFCLIILTMWASRTVLNGDGSLRSKKLTGSFLQSDNHKLCFQAMHGTTSLYCRRLRNQKRIYHEVYFVLWLSPLFISWQIWLIWLFYPCSTQMLQNR
jgi:hypothetical protein